MALYYSQLGHPTWQPSVTPDELITKMVQNDVQALGVKHATIRSAILPSWFSGERQPVGN